MKLLPALAASTLLAFAGGSAFAQQEKPSQAPLAAPAQSPLAVQSVPESASRPPATPEMRSARQALRASCAADMASLCPDAAAPASADPAAAASGASPARARMQCLRGHAAQLSTPCRQALVAMHDARKAARS